MSGPLDLGGMRDIGPVTPLECLSVKLNPELIEHLAHSNIFTAINHPKLQQVKVGQKYAFEKVFNMEDLAELVNCMGNNAADLTLCMNSYHDIQPQHFATEQLLEQHRLQRLTIENYALSVGKVTTAVKSLPNLRELYVDFDTSEPLPYHIVSAQSLNQMVGEHYPLGLNLQTLSVFGRLYCIELDEMLAVLILATLFSKVPELYLPNGYDAYDLIKELEGGLPGREGRQGSLG